LSLSNATTGLGTPVFSVHGRKEVVQH
jgi:hypothetical protein